MNRYQLAVAALVVSAIGGIIWCAGHYHDKWQKAEKRADAAEHNLTLANATIKDMQVRQRDAAVLDAKYAKELADAKSQLEDLQRCVSSGKCGLRVNARCPTSGAPGAGSLGNASGPRLTDPAQRDYFTLRERITEVTKQVGYLKDYIRTQCLN